MRMLTPRPPLLPLLPLTVAGAVAVVTIGCFGSDSLRGHDLGIYSDHAFEEDGGPDGAVASGDGGDGAVITADAPPTDLTGSDLSPPDAVTGDGPPADLPGGQPTGAGCASNDQCEGQLCVPETSGFPGGYCSAP